MTFNANIPITYFARTNKRLPYRTFGIKRRDRLSHLYVIGKTGTGKSTLLETLAIQDIRKGEGVTVVDPHGSLTDKIAANIPDHRRKDLIYFNPADPLQPYRYNPLTKVDLEKRPLAAGALLEVFHKIWGERAWGNKMEQTLRSCLLALMDLDYATLPDILRLLRDDNFRKSILDKISHKPVADFWRYEYPQYPWQYRATSNAPIVNKVSAFLSYPVLHKVFTEDGKMLDFRAIMDERKILLVNLAAGKLGFDAAALLGGMLVTSLGLSAFSRADTPEDKRPTHYLYLDEFQNVTTQTLAIFLAELRKFKLAIVMAHQYTHQLHPDIQHAVLGNAARW
jgi:energy-coupling factor transporter ATP-binding protein EcfA2